jgi:hypothetical protein
MSVKITKTAMDRLMITPERAEAIILCYGGNPAAWPEHEKTALEAFLAQSETLRALQKQLLSVDEFMGFVEPEPEIFDRQTALLAERILTNLPTQHQQAAKTSHQKNSPQNWWKKAAMIIKTGWPHSRPVYKVTALALAALLVINTTPENSHVEPELTVSEFMAFYGDDNQDSEINAAEEMEILAFWEPQLWDDEFL